MSQAAVGLIEAEARDDLETAESLKDKLKIAFKTAKNHWMFTDENEQFDGAVGAALMHAEGEDKERLMEEIQSLKALSAMLSGVSVNLPDTKFEPIGIVQMWRETNS